MMINYPNIDRQIQDVLAIYPNLKIQNQNEHIVQLTGSIHVFRKDFDFTVNKEYSLEIDIPLDNDELPSVYETGNLISTDFPHRYSDGKLCLETETIIRLRFIDGINLVSWIEDFVEPFFFSYEFYVRYKDFPFGERPHSELGILNTYQELFHENDIEKTCRLIRYVAERTYRGHENCPCGNTDKVRNCHGKFIKPFMIDFRKKNIVIADLEYLRKGLQPNEQSKENTRKTKRN